MFEYDTDEVCKIEFKSYHTNLQNKPREPGLKLCLQNSGNSAWRQKCQYFLTVEMNNNRQSVYNKFHNKIAYDILYMSIMGASLVSRLLTVCT